jgi:hypothetical protein
MELDPSKFPDQRGQFKFTPEVDTGTYLMECNYFHS